jgi:predicted Zn-dependent protease
MHEEALAETKKSLELSKASPATNLDLAWVYAMVGRRSAATKILAEVNKLPTSEAGGQTVKVAIVYAALGDKEQAFVWLEKASVLHAGGLEYLKTDPYWDDMRSDPRFQDLMRRVGLAP